MIPAALQVIAAFNLVCSGTERSGPLGQALPERDGAPFTITYRIDVDGGRWCSDPCDTVERLASVIEAQILLRDDHHPAGSNVVIFTPATGRFTDTRIAGNTATLRSGTCERAPFTGFPMRVA